MRGPCLALSTTPRKTVFKAPTCKGTLTTKKPPQGGLKHTQRQTMLQMHQIDVQSPCVIGSRKGPYNLYVLNKTIDLFVLFLKFRYLFFCF